MKKILSIIIAFTLSLTALFSLTACSGSYTYWQTEGKQSGEDRLIYISKVSFGSSTVELTEIWINVSNLKPSSTTLTFELLNSSSVIDTIDFELTSDMIKSAKDGWINVYFGNAVRCSKVSVMAIDQMRINEVVFIKSDATLIEPEFSQGGVKVSGANSENLYDREKLESITETDPAYSENPAYNIIDEQDKFPVKYIKTEA